MITGVALLYACTLAIPGKNGLLAAMGCMVCTMGKHILVDGLIPPPPVMVMTAGVIVALLAAPGEWGKRVFVGYCLLNAFTFTTQPLMVLTDTFPEITAGSPAYDVGAFAIEVITLYMVMAAVSAATPDEALAVAFSTQVGLPVLAKHVLINKSGPPGPMIGLYLLTTAVGWYEVGWSDYKPKAKAAVKEGPMKVHAMIVGTGFVPYFVLESIGLSMPMIGLSSIDSSYAYSGSTAMLCGMLAVFCAMTAWTEYTGQMEAKMFAMYHYFLSVVVALWQFQPSTSMLGAMFFAAPHMFTAWTVYLYMSKDKMA